MLYRERTVEAWYLLVEHLTAAHFAGRPRADCTSCSPAHSASYTVLGILRSCPCLSQSHRQSTTVVARPAPTVAVALQHKTHPFRWLCRTASPDRSCWPEGRVCSPFRPSAPRNDHISTGNNRCHGLTMRAFAPTRMCIVRAGQSVSGGSHEKRVFYALDLSTVRVRCTGDRLYKPTGTAR